VFEIFHFPFGLNEKWRMENEKIAPHLSPFTLHPSRCSWVVFFANNRYISGLFEEAN